MSFGKASLIDHRGPLKIKCPTFFHCGIKMRNSRLTKLEILGDKKISQMCFSEKYLIGQKLNVWENFKGKEQISP